MSVALEDLVARLRLDTSSIQGSLRNAQGAVSTAAAKMGDAGKTLSRNVTLPLVGVGVAGVKMAADFDKTMRQVAIATGGPSDALEALAVKMGAETAFSAKDASEAMLELAKGGMTAAQIQGGALAETMRLASAGGVDLASASTYVSNTMAAFGLKTKQASAVTVALAGAANASSASVESLGMGLSMSAAAAKNAGLSLQETTGVLSYFDSVGLKGSDAGTSLKSMLNSLIPTTNKARDAMKQANLDFVDAEGNFVGVANMAAQLKKGLGGLSEAQRAQALETIFGSDGMRAASALMNGGAKAVQKFTAASKDQKTTTELANAAMEGTSGAIERAQGSLETAALTLGQSLAPYAELAAGKIEALANWFSALDPATQGMIVKFGLVAAALGPALVAAGAVARGFSSIVGAGSTAVGAISKVGSAASATAKGAANLVGGFRNASTAASAASGKMGTLGGALRSTVSAVASAVGAMARYAAQTAANAARATAAVVAAATRQIAQWVLMAARATASAARIAAAWLISLGPIGILVAAVIAAAVVVVKNWDKIKDGVTRAAAVVAAKVQEVIGWFRDLPGKIKGFFSNAPAMLTGIGRDIVQGLVDGIRGAYDAVMGAVQGLIDKIPGPVKKALGINSPSRVMMEVGANTSDGLAIGIQSKTPAVADAAKKAAEAAEKAAAARKKRLENVGKVLMDGFGDGIFKSTEQVKTKMAALMVALEKVNSERAEKIATAAGKALKPLAREYANVQRQLSSAQSALAAFEAAREKVVQRQNALDMAGGDLTSLNFGEDADGNPIGPTADGVVNALTAVRDAAVTFDSTLAALAAAGLSQDALDQLIAKGPEAAAATAQAILAGGPQAIAQINALQAQIAASGLSITAKASSTMFEVGKQAQEGLIAGLESQMGRLEEQMQGIAKRMVRAIKKALKIKSPSRVMLGLGEFTGEGFAQGIASTAGLVSRASDALAAAALVSPPTLAPPGVSGAVSAAGGAFSAGAVTPEVRVFIGERELTDIVRVEVGGTLAPLRTLTRQGA